MSIAADQKRDTEELIATTPVTAPIRNAILEARATKRETMFVPTLVTLTAKDSNKTKMVLVSRIIYCKDGSLGLGILMLDNVIVPMPMTKVDEETLEVTTTFPLT